MSRQMTKNDTEENDIEEYIPTNARDKKCTSELYRDTMVENPMEDIEDTFFSIMGLSEEERKRIKVSKTIDEIDFGQTFQEWNRDQEPFNRILYPLEFDTSETENVQFDKPVTGIEYTAADGKKGTYNSSDIYQKKGSKKVNGVTLNFPSVISRRGYCELKEGTPKCIPFVMDVNNPHHRHFLYVTYKSFVIKVIEMMLMNPSAFGLPRKAFSEADIADKDSKKYKDAIASIYNSGSFKHFWRYPTEGEESDTESNMRMCFFNPIEKPGTKATKDKKASKDFITSVFLVFGGKSHKISLRQLEKICEGWEINENGEEVLGKPKSIEFAPKVLFSRATYTNCPSLKPTWTSLVVTDIFEGEPPKRADEARAAEAQAYANKSGDFSKFVGLEGFKDERRNFSGKPKEEKREIKRAQYKDSSEEEDNVDDDLISRKSERSKVINISALKESSERSDGEDDFLDKIKNKKVSSEDENGQDDQEERSTRKSKKNKTPEEDDQQEKPSGKSKKNKEQEENSEEEPRQKSSKKSKKSKNVEETPDEEEEKPSGRSKKNKDFEDETQITEATSRRKNRIDDDDTVSNAEIVYSVGVNEKKKKKKSSLIDSDEEDN